MAVAQPPLALVQRQVPEILAIDLKNVEAQEEGPVATEQQRPEIRLARRVEADDFPIEHRAGGPDAVRDLFGELRP